MLLFSTHQYPCEIVVVGLCIGKHIGETDNVHCGVHDVPVERRAQEVARLTADIKKMRGTWGHLVLTFWKQPGTTFWLLSGYVLATC